MTNFLKIWLVVLMMGTFSIVMGQEVNEDCGRWPLPDSFVNPKINRIDYKENLAHFFEKLSAYEEAVHQGSSVPKPKVLMIGDSHVRGNILPRQVRDSLERVWAIDFKYLCKNGVQLQYFLKPEQIDSIVAYKPDLLIVAVGTNEAHSNFDSERYTKLLREFTAKVLAGTDSATTIMFTTPPGSHIKKGGVTKGKKKVSASLLPNGTNKVVADCQDLFCRENGFAIWNLLDIAGGERAPSNWRGANLMQRDGIHYTVDAYRLQGNMLAWALIDARNSM